jgi:hypothetical protein
MQNLAGSTMAVFCGQRFLAAQLVLNTRAVAHGLPFDRPKLVIRDVLIRRTSSPSLALLSLQRIWRDGGSQVVCNEFEVVHFVLFIQYEASFVAESTG